MSKKNAENQELNQATRVEYHPSDKVISIASLRQSILNINDAKIEPISIPEWNANLHIKALNAAERDEFEDLMFDGNGKRKEDAPSSRAAMAYLSVCDENGQRIFQKEDIPYLAEKSGAALTRIFSRATTLSGMTKDELERLEKKSDAALSSDSHSD